MEWTPSETRTADAPLLVPNQMVHELRVPLDEDDDFGNESVSVPTGTWMSRCSDDESCCVTLLDADSAARSYERKQGCCGLEWAFCRHRAHFSVVLPIGPTNSTPRGDIHRRARPRSVRGASSHSRLPQVRFLDELRPSAPRILLGDSKTERTIKERTSCALNA